MKKNLLAFLLLPLLLSAKIYDCFLFYNELEVLEIRLNELYDAVDHFVLVECRETFQGHKKPFYFDENKERFAKFLDKIIHVKVHDRTTHTVPMKREHYQRNQIARGLQNCQDDDIIFISDVDEIIPADSISTILNHPQLQDPMLPVVRTRQKLYRYFLNRRECHRENPNQMISTRSLVATTYRYLKANKPQQIRLEKNNTNLDLLELGWHFSWMGGVERVIDKSKAYSHPNTPFGGGKMHDIKIIHEHMDSGRFEPINETFPKFVRENLDHFRNIGFIWED